MCRLKLSCAQNVMPGKRESLSLTSDFLFLKTIPSRGLIFHLGSKPDINTLEPGNLVVISLLPSQCHDIRWLMSSNPNRWILFVTETFLYCLQGLK